MDRLCTNECIRFLFYLSCFFAFAESNRIRNITLTNLNLLTFQDEKNSVFNDLENVRYPNDESKFNVAELGFEPIESEPVIEKIPFGASVYANRRHAPDRGFTDEIKREILDLHNMYRANVTPPSGDMAFMEWDTKLEHLAQLWADNCVFEHGRPLNTSYSFGFYGQNLYIGTDPTGYKALWMWYEEYNYYHLKNQTCEPGQQCGHYVQMAWAFSYKLGCGISKCGLRYLIVCHYFPQALRGIQIYTVARPCSQCPDENGALCKDDLCVSQDRCVENPELCETAKCNLKCQNCGRLDKEKCRCECADGWDSPDCSRNCTDKHERCGVDPGFPNRATCSLNKHAVARIYCRKMCESCYPYKRNTKYRHVCCEGKPCQEGYVLDLDRKLCRCTILCPGPQCDILDGTSASSKIYFENIILVITLLYFKAHYYFLHISSYP